MDADGLEELVTIMRKHGVAAFEGQWVAGGLSDRVSLTLVAELAQPVPVEPEQRETAEQYAQRMADAKADEDALLFASAGG